MHTNDNVGYCVICDVETTGRNSKFDEAIEISLLLCSFDRQMNNLLEVVERYTALRQPSSGKKNTASHINQITDSELLNQSWDQQAILSFFNRAEFVIAHYASFDKTYVTKVIPETNQIPWICSMNSIDWLSLEHSSRKLIDLAGTHGITTDFNHRAFGDTQLLFDLLNKESVTQQTYFYLLMQAIQNHPIESISAKRIVTKKEIEKSMNTLEGLLTGILIDGELNITELTELNYWLSVNQQFADVDPFSQIIPKVELMVQEKMLDNEWIEDIVWLCNQYRGNKQYLDLITADIQRLHGIIHGILSDNQITNEEIYRLQDWMDENTHLSSNYPYDELYALLGSILSDGRVDQDERNVLTMFIADFIDENASTTIDHVALRELKQNYTLPGVCVMNPDITIANNSFCITGDSNRVNDRNEFKRLIESKNGIFHANLRKDTKYLVIGDKGSEAWAFACYGRKVEKAIEMRKSGCQILIIHENDFWDVV